MFEVAFAGFYSFVLAFQRACFYSRCLFGLYFFWFERRIFGRLNAILPASKTIKARASSYPVSYMEQQTPFTSRSRVGISAGWLLGMEGLFGIGCAQWIGYGLWLMRIRMMDER